MNIFNSHNCFKNVYRLKESQNLRNFSGDRMQCKLPRNCVALSGSLGHPKLFISTNLRSQPAALSFPTLQSTVSYKLWFSRCNLWTPVIPESLSRSLWNQNYSHNNMKGFFFCPFCFMNGATINGEKHFWNLTTNHSSTTKLIIFSSATHSHLEERGRGRKMQLSLRMSLIKQ